MKQRKYTAEEKLSVVLEMMKGKKTVVQICKEHGIRDSQAYKWKDEALESMKQGFSDKSALRPQNSDPSIIRLAGICPLVQFKTPSRRFEFLERCSIQGFSANLGSACFDQFPLKFKGVLCLILRGLDRQTGCKNGLYGPIGSLSLYCARRFPKCQNCCRPLSRYPLG